MEKQRVRKALLKDCYEIKPNNPIQDICRNPREVAVFWCRKIFLIGSRGVYQILVFIVFRWFRNTDSQVIRANIRIPPTGQATHVDLTKRQRKKSNFPELQCFAIFQFTIISKFKNPPTVVAYEQLIKISNGLKKIFKIYEAMTIHDKNCNDDGVIYYFVKYSC